MRKQAKRARPGAHKLTSEQKAERRARFDCQRAAATAKKAVIDRQVDPAILQEEVLAEIEKLGGDATLYPELANLLGFTEIVQAQSMTVVSMNSLQRQAIDLNADQLILIQRKTGETPMVYASSYDGHSQTGDSPEFRKMLDEINAIVYKYALRKNP